MKKAKIATCCHCGARQVLDVAHLKRLRLECDSCGAPITRLAPLTSEDKRAPRREVERKPAYAPRERPRAHSRHVRKKRRKSLLWEVLDELEDIFD